MTSMTDAVACLVCGCSQAVSTSQGGLLSVMLQALEGQPLPPLVEGEGLPLKEVELHQVGTAYHPLGVFSCMP